MGSLRRAGIILLSTLMAIGFTVVVCNPASAAGATSVGAGSGNPMNFINAYNQTGGSAKVGSPTNAVHTWGTGCNQDFSGGWSGRAAFMQPGCTGPVYPVVYKQWQYVLSTYGNNAPAMLGYPVMADHRWGNGWGQDFNGGAMGYTVLARGDATGQVHAVRSGFLNTWVNVYHDVGGPLGFPKTDEYGWAAGTRQDFEGGSLIWDQPRGVRLLTATPSILPKEQHAVDWALAEVNSPRPWWSDEFHQCWSGMCEGFVEIAYGTRGWKGSAYQAYQWQAANGRVQTGGTPPRGALVYYNAWGKDANGNMVNYGHVVLSLGDGNIVGTQGWGGQCQNVAVHPLSYFSGYLGWARAPDALPGR